MPMRQRLIAGNWKMYKTRQEAHSFARELGSLWPPTDGGAAPYALAQLPEAVVCAPFTSLAELVDVLAKSATRLGAQNVHEQPEGAFTGEISAVMLRELGCAYVVIGHSERRAYYRETSEAVAHKSVVALEAFMAPIVCVGESLEEREAGRTQEVIAAQLEPVLQSLYAYAHAHDGVTKSSGLDVGATVVAYEPIWAIGTGKSSSATDAETVIGWIRARIAERLGQSVAGRMRILYGGSVKPDNIATYLAQPDIDGALVGGASLQPSSFVELLRQSIRT